MEPKGLSVTTAQAEKIMELHGALLEYDKQPVWFQQTPTETSLGRFTRHRQYGSGHVNLPVPLPLELHPQFQPVQQPSYLVSLIGDTERQAEILGNRPNGRPTAAVYAISLYSVRVTHSIKDINTAHMAQGKIHKNSWQRRRHNFIDKKWITNVSRKGNSIILCTYSLYYFTVTATIINSKP